MDPLALSKVIDLRGKTAIVTGGAVGIGYGISSHIVSPRREQMSSSQISTKKMRKKALQRS
jgi:short-subunit dehydrogenase involved in D-alanine esterification of teichoic acids